MSPRPLASISLDLDDLWSYLKTHGDQSWPERPSYLDRFVPRGEGLVRLRASHFLWKMVRSITGTLVHLEERGFGEAEIRSILESRERKLAGPTAPAAGLFLWDVRY